jgi:signal recognition particle GTPase
MKVYNYNDEKKFTYEEDARIDPLETQVLGKDVYLLPAKATFKKALEAKEGFDVVFNEKEGKWEYKETPVIKDEESLLKEKTQKQRLQEAVWELENYLTSTDYKIIKAVELNESLDEELKSKRQKARQDIKNLNEQLSQVKEA